MPRADSSPKRRTYVKVIKTEEKGSDVNMATHLLRDGFRNEYQAAVMITNDSDLLEPVRIVRQELGFTIGILNPHQRASRVLAREACAARPEGRAKMRLSRRVLRGRATQFTAGDRRVRYRPGHRTDDAAKAHLQTTFAGPQQPFARLQSSFAALHTAFAALHRSCTRLQRVCAALQTACAGLHKSFATLHRPSDALHMAIASLQTPFVGAQTSSVGVQISSVGVQTSSVGVQTSLWAYKHRLWRGMS